MAQGEKERIVSVRQHYVAMSSAMQDFALTVTLSICACVEVCFTLLQCDSYRTKIAEKSNLVLQHSCEKWHTVAVYFVHDYPQTFVAVVPIR